MNVDGEKIRTLIEVYGKEREYPSKSYLSKFCEDNDVNYSQWNAHIGGRQVVGTKILDKLMYVFPDLNMNWLLKDDPNMFTRGEIKHALSEPPSKYAKNVTNEDLMNKLEEILIQTKKVSSKGN
jgi:hypothetical protein